MEASEGSHLSYVREDSRKCAFERDPLSFAAVQVRSDPLLLFFLEGVEIVVFAHILVFFCDLYTGGSKQLPVLLSPEGRLIPTLSWHRSKWQVWRYGE